MSSPVVSGREINSGVLARAVRLMVMLAVVAGVTIFIFLGLADYNWNWSAVAPYWQVFLRGWLMTIAISICALIGSMLAGLLAALAQGSKVATLRMLATLYVELVRGSPLLVQILVLYYAVFQVFGLQDAFIAGVLILSLFAGAYIAEMLRAGFASVGRSQLESAMAVGFTGWQRFRFVIMPQAMRHVIPPLAGQFASIIKDSSLLSVVSIREFTLSAQDINSATYSPFESYLPLAVGYLLLTVPVSLWSRRLEKRFRYET